MFSTSNIKQEKPEVEDSIVNSGKQSIKTEIKQEIINEDECISIKTEVKQETSEENKTISTFRIIREAAEVGQMSLQEESYLSPMLETPVKNEIKPEIFFEDSTNPSPFNKEMFRNFNLNQESPQSKDDVYHSFKVETRKSVKRTVFQRDSPYKRYSDESNSSQPKLSAGKSSVKDRLGEKIDENGSEV